MRKTSMVCAAVVLALALVSGSTFGQGIETDTETETPESHEAISEDGVVLNPLCNIPGIEATSTDCIQCVCNGHFTCDPSEYTALLVECARCFAGGGSSA